GPTAADRKAEVAARFQGPEMLHDEQLQQRIAEILAPFAKRWPNLDREALRAGNRKQATIPAGSTVLGPVGTAPGLVVPPPGQAGATIVGLPGPPREPPPMRRDAAPTDARATPWRTDS